MLITDTNKIETYYQALLDRNQSFVGIFFVGVKTTSVFCIATCRARKPKLKNVEFYTSFKEALDNGYRPCKICKPTENANQAPEQVEKAIILVKENPKDKITDFQLRQKGISPEVVRRWFKNNYGMTFQAYQRMYRINNAFQELKKGKNATHTAFDTSYESLSGFGYTFKKLVGKSPKQIKDNGVKEKEMSLQNDIIQEIIRSYTKESGVRNLEREISKVARKVVKKVVSGEEKEVKINKENLSDFLGVPKFKSGELETENRVGIVTGLAWTEYGGEILKIETHRFY